MRNPFSIRRNTGRRSSPESQWFWDHYEWAAGQIVEFCASAGLALQGLEIADVGCGDGILSLGLYRAAQPRRLVGFDVVPTDIGVLLSRCRQEGVPDSLPAELEFRTSSDTVSPAEDDEFDFVCSWSAFEHVSQPLAVMREIRRILRPGGNFFLQLWPFYRSGKGSHLWDWFGDDFHHLRCSEQQIVSDMGASDLHPPDLTSYMSDQFQRLNRVTLDELQRAVLAGGFDVYRLELETSTVQLSPDLARYSWADLAISGIKLLAKPAQ